MRTKRAQAPVGLDERLAALGQAVELGRGVVDEADVAAAEALIARAGDRLGHGVEHTVVALAGATGSGKSSLFNALAGEPLSDVGVRRPMTSTTHACTWGADAGPLLDWLAIGTRHHSGGQDPDLDGLVLLDLPDHDSTTLAHRREVDRIVQVADMVVWVLDPQKYADAAVHEGYLRPLSGHAGVLVVVLNQADRLTAEQLTSCEADLGRLLHDDGLDGVPVRATSARTGAGIAELRAELGQRVQARNAALDRLGADLDRVVARLWTSCDGADRATPLRRSDRSGQTDRRQMVDALATAAGVDTVAEAVAGSHRARATARTGWPATRWVRRLRPDPLRRLHLGQGGGHAARTSLPPTGAVPLAQVTTAVRQATDRASQGLPLPWVDAMRTEVAARMTAITDRLDAAVAGTDLGSSDTPRWWSVVNAVQVVFAVIAVVGAIWLGVLAGVAYLRLGDLGTPDVGRIPLPTALLIGGVLAGLLLALVARRLASIGARRRARRARLRLCTSVDEVAQTELLAPMDALMARHDRFCQSLAGAGPAPSSR